MAFISQVILFLAINICQSTNIDTFDWEGTLEKVQQDRELWESQNINSYVYHFQMNAMLPPCALAPKYVLVKNNEVTYVQYDELYLYENNLDCDDIEINPSHFQTIDNWFELAIQHLQEGIDADCSGTEPDDICGGSEVIECDSRVHYPKRIQLFYGPFISNDAGDYIFGCFTSFDDLYRESYGQYQYPGECLIDISLMLQLYSEMTT